MTEPTADFEGLGPASDQEGGAGVPHVMGSEIEQARLLYGRLKEAITPVLESHRMTLWGQEHKVLCLPWVEFDLRGLGKCDGSDARPRFASFSIEMTFGLHKVLGDTDPSILDSPMSEPEDFAHPEPTPAPESDDASVTWMDRFRQRFNLVN